MGGRNGRNDKFLSTNFKGGTKGKGPKKEEVERGRSTGQARAPVLPSEEVKDLFGVLGFERRPWLEEEEVKKRFIEASGEAHPDRFHSAAAREKTGAEERFAELNAAQSTLRNARERLVHFLALEGITMGGQVQNVPAAAMEFFSSVGQLTREVEMFRAEKGKASSPMMKAQMFQKGLDWTDKMQELAGKLSARIEAPYVKVKELDGRWGEAGERERKEILRRLEEIARGLSFLERWRGQLQEQIHALAF